MKWLDDPQPWPRRKFAGQLTYFLAWLGMTVVGLVLSPSPDGHGTHQMLGLPPCPSMLAFGKPCPGCGLTTSVAATLEGRLDLAWQAHPVGVVLYLLFTLTAIYAGVRYAQGVRLRSESPAVLWMSWSAVIAILIFGAVRFVQSPDVRTPAERALVDLVNGK